MLLRISLLLLLLSIISSTGSIILDRIDDAIVLSENPMQLATELLHEERLEEVLYLVRFSRRYLPVDAEYANRSLENEAQQTLDSPMFLLERFTTGALTGEASDTAGLLGSLTLDMLVIGDIRDLLVQGYKELDSGQGDEVIMGLSAAGLLLTLAPELSWTPSLFKTFWRGSRFSEPFQKQLANALSKARKTGDLKGLKHILTHFSEVIDNLGAGPAMSVLKHVKSTDDLVLLAKKSKIAPMESYTLTSINGVKSLEHISTTSVKQGKLVKRVKLATRQQKIISKLFGLIPLYMLVVVCIIFTLFFVLLLFRPRK